MSKEKASKKLRKENLYIPPSPYWNEDYSRELRDYTAYREFFERMLDEIVQSYWERIRLHLYHEGADKCTDYLRSAWGLKCEIKQLLDKFHTLLTNPHVIDPDKEEPSHE